MIQTKTIAIVMIAIATVGVIGTAGLLVHANAAVSQTFTNQDCPRGGYCLKATHSNPESINQPAISNPEPSNLNIHIQTQR